MYIALGKYGNPCKKGESTLQHPATPATPCNTRQHTSTHCEIAHRDNYGTKKKGKIRGIGGNGVTK